MSTLKWPLFTDLTKVSSRWIFLPFSADFFLLSSKPLIQENCYYLFVMTCLISMYVRMNFSTDSHGSSLSPLKIETAWITIIYDFNILKGFNCLRWRFQESVVSFVCGVLPRWDLQRRKSSWKGSVKRWIWRYTILNLERFRRRVQSSYCISSCCMCMTWASYRAHLLVHEYVSTRNLMYSRSLVSCWCASFIIQASYDLMDTDKNSITTTRRTTNSSAQRRSMINGDYFLDFFKLKIYFNLKELKYFLFFSCQRQPSCISVVRSRFLIFWSWQLYWRSSVFNNCYSRITLSYAVALEPDIQDCPKNTYSASYLDTTTVTSR